MEDTVGFAEGLEDGELLVREFITTKDPALVRAMASHIEAHARTVREFGIASALRRHASRLEFIGRVSLWAEREPDLLGGQS